MKKRVIYQYKDAEIDVDVEAHDAESWTDQRHLLAMVQQVVLCAEGWGEFELHVVRIEGSSEHIEGSSNDIEGSSEYIEGSKCITLPDGTQEWYRNGQLHREDGPAIVYPGGSQSWWIDGNLHREDGPALVSADGRKEWRLNGRRHREDGPAVIRPNGSKEWWIDGILIDQSIPPSEESE